MKRKPPPTEEEISARSLHITLGLLFLSLFFYLSRVLYLEPTSPPWKAFVILAILGLFGSASLLFGIFGSAPKVRKWADLTPMDHWAWFIILIPVYLVSFILSAMLGASSSSRRRPAKRRR